MLAFSHGLENMKKTGENVVDYFSRFLPGAAVDLVTNSLDGCVSFEYREHLGHGGRCGRCGRCFALLPQKLLCYRGNRGKGFR
jgi:hypothetical protein